jgi:hypothetical protein
LAILACGGGASSAAEPAAVLVVPSSPATLHVAVDLPHGIKPDESQAWRLVEIGGEGGGAAAQGVPAPAADGTVASVCGRLVADIRPRQGAEGPRRFRLEAAPAPGPADFAFSTLDDKSLKLVDGNRPVFVYNYGTITNGKVPKQDSRRSRACYIHPLWGLDGEVLTDDFPRDHYHHHGVFWAWPHVAIDGKQYDLWMYKNISQKFVRWLCRETGPVAAVLGVENGWFVGDKKVMIERVWLRAGKAAGDERPLDLEFVWIPVDRPITLRGAEAKSYGGLTVRFAVRNPKQATITVPQGQPAADLPDTPLPWCDLTTTFAAAAAASGAAIFAPADHPDFPPTWLTRHYGPICVGWPGVHGQTFEPGRPIHLRYRIWIHRAAVGVPQLREAYQAYAVQAKWELP